MKLFFRRLILNFKQAEEILNFADFNYYHGQVGAGKSSIARLVHFCLGGDLDYTQALQQEFVAATLDLEVEGKPLLLARTSEENQIRARWNENGQTYEALLPARQAGGEVLPGTGIQVPSDLLFHLASVSPPRVHAGKAKDTDQSVLTFSDFYSFCYLDQDSMDSNFFDLGCQRSRGVIQHLIGWHHDAVLDLQEQLTSVGSDRKNRDQSLKVLKEALASEYLATPSEIASERQQIQGTIANLDAQIAAARAATSQLRPHGVEQLQARGRKLATRISDIDSALKGIEENVAKDKTYLNTLVSLSNRQKRAESARTILAGVEFTQCPRCQESLPARTEGLCPVCGQSHSTGAGNPVSSDAVEADIRGRVEELQERIDLQLSEVDRLQHLRGTVSAQKETVDRDLNQALERYDSAYLSAVEGLVTERAGLTQRLADLRQPESLAKKVAQQQEEAARLRGQEAELRAKLKNARAEAQRDKANLELLKTFFLDCLVRSRLPGFHQDDSVEISPTNFLPQVSGKNDGSYTSFSNLGSGGKKCFFKACFAVALHRLAAHTKGLWPTVLVIDSPMKNTSERENADQFAGFYEMLYELKETELRSTQFIIMDKEFFSPRVKNTFKFQQRHMRPGDPQNPPLIPYHRGK